VAIPTVTGHQLVNNEALDFIEDYLAERGLHIYRARHDDFGVLLATTRPTKTPKVLLVGHIDVVAAPAHQFTVREKDDKLYGRGVLDMKSGIAGYMVAVDQLAGYIADYDFGIMITIDEEGRNLGVQKMIADGYYPTEAAILLDGAYDWQIEAAAKAAWCVTAKVKGTNGHGSRPWQADSASMRMIGFLHELQQLFPENAPNTNTLNISYIGTGAKEVLNQVPNFAQATLDIRLISNAACDDIKQAAGKIAKKYDVELITAVEFKAIEHDMTNPHMTAFARHIKKQTRVTSKGDIWYAVSDAARYVERGIACIVTYPKGGGHHSDDEWIDTQSLDDIAPIITGYLHEMAKVPQRALVESQIQPR